MYQIGVKQSFIALHQLIGGDWGAENTPHAHHFAVEVLLSGKDLNQHGYLFDIAALKDGIDTIVARFKNELLNNFSEFKDLNPSIEHFARVFLTQLTKQVAFPAVETLTVRMWEDENAYASYSQNL